MKRTLGARPRRGWLWIVGGVGVVVALVVVWRATSVGPAPEMSIATGKPAIGPATSVVARFVAPRGGLGLVRLELVEGDRVALLGEKRFARPDAFSFGFGAHTDEARIEATVGAKTQEWLTEGEAVLRASADRMSGPLRSPGPVVVVKRMQVRLRPPRLEVVSAQTYVREGGSGVVRLRVGPTAVRSGVTAGDDESLSFPLPGGAPDERFALFAVPWDLADGSGVRAFAEDDAGNRVEIPFLSGFRPSPPSTDTITLTDAFLARVVPAIESQTPGLRTTGDVLDRYLEINGKLRRQDLAEIRTITRDTTPRFLWRGAFEQMPHTAKRANFAERRTYVHAGQVVDHQTHLGLDLASTAHAPVPAANSGRILHAGWLGIYGNAVIIDHGFGLASLYGHLSEIDVKVGQSVARGQIIGRSGETGLAGGDHLHFETFIQGHSVSPIEWLDAKWIRDNVANKLESAGAALTR
jgi:murein DD-endopeptidase MepM/ murein hydrolase activator NlpD